MPSTSRGGDGQKWTVALANSRGSACNKASATGTPDTSEGWCDGRMVWSDATDVVEGTCKSSRFSFN